MNSWTLTIPFKNGESSAELTIRISREIEKSKNENGVLHSSTSPDIREVVNVMMETQRAGRIRVMEVGRSSVARRIQRFPTAEVAVGVSTDAVTLEKATARLIPEASPGAIADYAAKLGPRRAAIDAALKGSIGLDRAMRIPHLAGKAGQEVVASLVGYDGTKSQKLEGNEAAKLRQMVNQAVLGLSVDLPDGRPEQIVGRGIRERHFSLNKQAVDEFRMMIQAYHAVREANSLYLQRMFPGIDGARDGSALVRNLVPTPDDMIRGATAFIIVDSQQKDMGLSGSGFAKWVADFKNWA